MKTTEIINERVEEFIGEGLMFTSVDIANAIKRDGIWISNSEVAESLRGMNMNQYTSSLIYVDNGDNTITWASCYHHYLVNPNKYLARDSKAISMEQFKELYEIKPVTKDMLVVDDGVVMTDTRVIAEVFGKRHDNVIQKLENLGISDEFNALHFKVVKYVDKKGETRSMYKMDQDGWALVVMGFTGAKAMKFKEEYINAFRAMNDYIVEQNAHKIPQTYSEALLLAGKQAQKIEEDAPKVEYHDTVKECGGGILLGDFSKSLAPEIMIGQKKLFTFLRDKRILQSAKGSKDISWNTPYQRYIDQGYFFIDPGTRPSNSEGFKKTATTRITGKGQIWLTKMLKKHLNA